MKKLFYLLACFCGFSLQAGQGIIAPRNNNLNIQIVENSTGYRNCICSASARNLFACHVCQQSGCLTPVLNASCPSPKIGDKPSSDYSLRIIRSFDNFNVVDMGCPTPTTTDPKK